MRTILTKNEITAMKDKVNAAIELRNGKAAHVKYHRQNQYVEAYIAVYMNDRTVMKVRLYSDGQMYFMTVRSFITDRFYLPNFDFLAPVGSPS